MTSTKTSDSGDSSGRFDSNVGVTVVRVLTFIMEWH